MDIWYTIINDHPVAFPLVKSELQTHFCGFVHSDQSSRADFWRGRCNSRLGYGLSFSNNRLCNSDSGLLTFWGPFCPGGRTTFELPCGKRPSLRMHPSLWWTLIEFTICNAVSLSNSRCRDCSEGVVNYSHQPSHQQWSRRLHAL